MSQAAALIMPTLPTPKTLSLTSSRRQSATTFVRFPPISGRVLNCLGSRASSRSVVKDGDPIARLERCFLRVPNFGPVMNYGAVGQTTLEKPKLDNDTTKPTPEQAGPSPDSGGGDGGDNKGVGTGGGNGGGRDDDDDNYFENFDDDGNEADDGGIFRLRIILEQLFGRKFVDAVLIEWGKTVMDLPAEFRQACEMGLVSSAEIGKFLATNAKCSVKRLIIRFLQPGLSRAFIGRLTADPAFFERLLLEQATTIGFSVWSETNSRKGRLKQEWHLVLMRTLIVTARNTFFYCTLAPCRLFTLQKLPNNIFQRNYPPLSEFSHFDRFQSLLHKTALLCMVGVASQGAATLSTLVATNKKKAFRLSETIRNVLVHGAVFGLVANLRYQLVCGFDRRVDELFDVIGVSLFFSTTMRVLNVGLGEMSSRLDRLGAHELDDDDLKKAYIRASEGVNNQSSNDIISVLGIKQGQNDDLGEAPLPKARRKRLVKRRVVATI